MNKILVIVFFCFSVLKAVAQPKGFTAVKNVSSFQQQLSQANNSKQTITSDFNQTKHLSLLADKIKSKGKFYFKKEDKVRIEYTSPFTYLLIMNGGQILVKDEQKTSKINTRNSASMQSVNRIMIDCMRGSVFQNTDFKVSAFENANSFLLSLSPSDPAMKKLFDRIDVYLDKKNFDVSKLSMMENGGDYTEMEFLGTQHNTPLNDALFKAK